MTSTRPRLQFKIGRPGADDFDENLHPRDRKGRFIETGAEVRIWGGQLGTVLRNVGGGRIEVERADGAKVIVHRNYLTVTKSADGNAPKTDASEAPADLPEEQASPDAQVIPELADGEDEVLPERGDAPDILVDAPVAGQTVGDYTVGDYVDGPSTIDGWVVGFTATNGPIIRTEDGQDWPLLPDAVMSKDPEGPDAPAALGVPDSQAVAGQAAGEEDRQAALLDFDERSVAAGAERDARVEAAADALRAADPNLSEDDAYRQADLAEPLASAAPAAPAAPVGTPVPPTADNPDAQRPGPQAPAQPAADAPYVDEDVSLDDLEAMDSANINIDPERLAALVEDMRANGPRGRLLVEETQSGPLLTDGNGRLAAARELGLDSLPVRRYANTPAGRSAANRAIVDVDAGRGLDGTEAGPTRDEVEAQRGQTPAQPADLADMSDPDLNAAFMEATEAGDTERATAIRDEYARRRAPAAEPATPAAPEDDDDGPVSSTPPSPEGDIVPAGEATTIGDPALSNTRGVDPEQWFRLDWDQDRDDPSYDYLSNPMGGRSFRIGGGGIQGAGQNYVASQDDRRINFTAADGRTGEVILPPTARIVPVDAPEDAVASEVDVAVRNNDRRARGEQPNLDAPEPAGNDLAGLTDADLSARGDAATTVEEVRAVAAEYRRRIDALMAPDAKPVYSDTNEPAGSDPVADTGSPDMSTTATTAPERITGDDVAVGDRLLVGGPTGPSMVVTDITPVAGRSGRTSGGSSNGSASLRITGVDDNGNVRVLNRPSGSTIRSTRRIGTGETATAPERPVTRTRVTDVKPGDRIMSPSGDAVVVRVLSGEGNTGQSTALYVMGPDDTEASRLQFTDRQFVEVTGEGQPVDEAEGAILDQAFADYTANRSNVYLRDAIREAREGGAAEGGDEGGEPIVEPEPTPPPVGGETPDPAPVDGEDDDAPVSSTPPSPEGPIVPAGEATTLGDRALGNSTGRVDPDQFYRLDWDQDRDDPEYQYISNPAGGRAFRIGGGGIQGVTNDAIGPDDRRINFTASDGSSGSFILPSTVSIVPVDVPEGAVASATDLAVRNNERRANGEDANLDGDAEPFVEPSFLALADAEAAEDRLAAAKAVQRRALNGRAASTRDVVGDDAFRSLTGLLAASKGDDRDWGTALVAAADAFDADSKTPAKWKPLASIMRDHGNGLIEADSAALRARIAPMPDLDADINTLSDADIDAAIKGIDDNIVTLDGTARRDALVLRGRLVGEQNRRRAPGPATDADLASARDAGRAAFDADRPAAAAADPTVSALLDGRPVGDPSSAALMQAFADGYQSRRDEEAAAILRPEPTPDPTPAPGQTFGGPAGDIAIADPDPIAFPYIRNPQSSTASGADQSAFGQDVEPAGRYLSNGSDTGGRVPDGWQSGEVSFQQPLIMDFGGGYNDDSNWKRRLSARYDGRTGEALSNALRADGYDAIITRDRYGDSEVVDLSRGKAEVVAPEPEPVGDTTTEAVRVDELIVGDRMLVDGEGVVTIDDITIDDDGHNLDYTDADGNRGLLIADASSVVTRVDNAMAPNPSPPADPEPVGNTDERVGSVSVENLVADDVIWLGRNRVTVTAVEDNDADTRLVTVRFADRRTETLPFGRQAILDRADGEFLPAPSPIDSDVATSRPVLYTYQRKNIVALGLDADDDPMVAEATRRIRTRQPLAAVHSAALAQRLASMSGETGVKPQRQRMLLRLAAANNAASIEAGGRGVDLPDLPNADSVTRQKIGDHALGDQIAFRDVDGSVATGRITNLRTMMSGRLTEVTFVRADGSERTTMLTKNADTFLLPDLPEPTPVRVEGGAPELIPLEDVRVGDTIRLGGRRDLFEADQDKLEATVVRVDVDEEGDTRVMLDVKSVYSNEDDQALVVTGSGRQAIRTARGNLSVDQPRGNDLPAFNPVEMDGEDVNLGDWVRGKTRFGETYEGIVVQIETITSEDGEFTGQKFRVESPHSNGAWVTAIGQSTPVTRLVARDEQTLSRIEQAKREREEAMRLHVAAGQIASGMFKMRSAEMLDALRDSIRNTPGSDNGDLASFDVVDGPAIAYRDAFNDIRVGAGGVLGRRTSVRIEVEKAVEQGIFLNLTGDPDPSSPVNLPLRTAVQRAVSDAIIEDVKRIQQALFDAEPTEPGMTRRQALLNVVDLIDDGDAPVAERDYIAVARGLFAARDALRAAEVDDDARTFQVPDLPADADIATRMKAYRAALPSRFGSVDKNAAAFESFSLADLEAGQVPKIVTTNTRVRDKAADGGPGADTMAQLDVVLAAGRDLDVAMNRRILAEFPELGDDPEEGLKRGAAEVEVARKAYTDSVRAVREMQDTVYASYRDDPRLAGMTGVERAVEAATLAQADQRTLDAQAARDAANDAYKTVSERWRDIGARLAMVRAKAARDTLSEFRDLGGTLNYVGTGQNQNTPASENTAPIKAMRYAESNYPSDWFKRAGALGDIRIGVTSRGKYVPSERKILMSKSRSDDKGIPFARVATHELGHLMEDFIPGLYEAEQAYLWKRTATGEVGSRKRHRTGTTDKSATYADEFPESYTGKDYGQQFFEVFTTGMESLFAGSPYLDPEFRQWLLGTLAMID